MTRSNGDQLFRSNQQEFRQTMTALMAVSVFIGVLIGVIATLAVMS